MVEETATMAPPAEARGTAPNRPPAIEVRDTGVAACYANFCRVTGTPEELILDVGLNSHPMGGSPEPIAITQRLVLNFYTAKRLLQALSVAVARHEHAFGPLEADVNKRVVPRNR